MDDSSNESDFESNNKENENIEENEELRNIENQHISESNLVDFKQDFFEKNKVDELILKDRISVNINPFEIGFFLVFSYWIWMIITDENNIGNEELRNQFKNSRNSYITSSSSSIFSLAEETSNKTEYRNGEGVLNENNQIIHQGYLKKENPNGLIWKTRYFVLIESKLYYYYHQSNMNEIPLGYISIAFAKRVSFAENSKNSIYFLLFPK